MSQARYKDRREKLLHVPWYIWVFQGVDENSTIIIAVEIVNTFQAELINNAIQDPRSL